MGSKERPKAEDARPISPSVGMYHLGESWTGRSGRDQPTAETTIKVKEDTDYPSFLDRLWIEVLS